MPTASTLGLVRAFNLASAKQVKLSARVKLLDVYFALDERNQALTTKRFLVFQGDGGRLVPQRINGAQVSCQNDEL